MPIYEYKCPACQKIFEEWVHLSEMHDAVPCPDCGQASPRIMSETSFVLKGGGWYVTDYGYRKGVKEDGTKTESKDGTTSDAKTGGSVKADAKPATEAKPAAAPAAKPAAASAPKAAGA